MLSRLARGLVKRSASSWDRMRPPEQGLTILIYHRVGRRSSASVDLPDWLFEEQMARISDGRGAVSLDVALEMLGRTGRVGSSPVAVTFDDGTADFVDIALPILVRHRVPATLYIATEFIETGKAFPQNGTPASWAAIRDALSTGLVTVGSHTHSHALLDRLEPSRAAADLDRSKDLIAERLGMEACHFAYPKALAGSPECAKEVAARFRSAALAGTRPNPYGSTDPMRLSRSPVQVEDGLHYFERKLSGGMRLEDDLRTMINRRRFAGLTS